MDWFEGPIPEAIQESRKRRSLFVVYIKGDPSYFSYYRSTEIMTNVIMRGSATGLGYW